MDDTKVAVLIEDLMSQFRTLGQGLQQLNDQMNRRFDDVDKRFDQNDKEHQALKLMIQELAVDQKEIKQKVNELDQEFEIKMRQVK